MKEVPPVDDNTGLPSPIDGNGDKIDEIDATLSDRIGAAGRSVREATLLMDSDLSGAALFRLGKEMTEMPSLNSEIAEYSA